MCMSCGCGSPNDDHGDSRNITLNAIDQAAIAAGTTRDRVLQNMMSDNQASQQNTSADSQNQQDGSNSSSTNNDEASRKSGSAQSQYEQTPIMQTGYGQQQQQQQGQVLEGDDGKIPGQRVQTPGTESGTAWGQGEDQANYQPPVKRHPTS